MCKIGDKPSPFFISFFEILLRKNSIIYTVVAKQRKIKGENNMLKKMIKTSAVTLLLAGTTVGSITPAFAQIQTKDVTEKDFLEYIERLKKENPKLNVVEDEPVMYSSAKEAQAAYTEQLKSLKASFL